MKRVDHSGRLEREGEVRGQCETTDYRDANSTRRSRLGRSMSECERADLDREGEIRSQVRGTDREADATFIRVLAQQ